MAGNKGAGAGRGAMTGAAAGTMIAPGIGTAIGAGAGALYGYLSSSDDGYTKGQRDFLSELSGVEKPAEIYYKGIADESGNLGANYQLEDSKNWIQRAMEQQAAEEAALGNKATSQSLGAQAQAAQQLGAKGGMRGGAAERIAKSGSRDLMQSLQDVNMQGIQNRGLIGLKGEEMNRDTSKFNIGNRIQDQQNRQAFEMEKYKQKMADYAAAQSARGSIMANQGGGGGKK